MFCFCFADFGLVIADFTNLVTAMDYEKCNFSSFLAV